MARHFAVAETDRIAWQSSQPHGLLASCRAFEDSAMQLFQGQSSEESQASSEAQLPQQALHSGGNAQHQWLPLRQMSVPAQVRVYDF